mgnify:FL=1
MCTASVRSKLKLLAKALGKELGATTSILLFDAAFDVVKSLAAVMVNANGGDKRDEAVKVLKDKFPELAEWFINLAIEAAYVVLRAQLGGV